MRDKPQTRYFHAVFDEKSFTAKGQKAVEILNENGVEVVRVRGYASTISKDRYGDIVLPTAFEKTIEDFMKNPVILLQHNMDKPIGKVVGIQIDDVGLYITADITEDVDGCKSAIKNGVLKGFSIGYDVLDYDYLQDQDDELAFVIKEIELMEISIVSIPANRLTLIKSYKMSKKDTTAEILEDGAEKVVEAIVDGAKETAENVLEVVKETADKVIEEAMEEEETDEVAKDDSQESQERENSSETEKSARPQSEKNYISKKEFEAYKAQTEEVLLKMVSAINSANQNTNNLKKSLEQARVSKGASFVPSTKSDGDVLTKAVQNLLTNK